MAKNLESLAKKLGTTIVGTVPDYPAGVFGMAALANIFRERAGGTSTLKGGPPPAAVP